MKIAVCGAALALGIALGSVPAFAQSMQMSDFSTTTRGANDGGMVGLATGPNGTRQAAPSRQSREYYNYAPVPQASGTSTTARGANDGGMVR